MLPKENENLLLNEKSFGAYLGLAIGDALGATTEFMTPAEISAKHGTLINIEGGGWLGLPKGMVTDDTTMALALGKSIIEYRGFNAEHMALAFSEWMQKMPVDIGNTVRRGIVHFRHSGSTEAPMSEYDAGNGAVMRCLPVILATLDADSTYVERALYMQAHITHNNPLSDAALRMLAHTMRSSMRGADKNELLFGPVAEVIDQYPEFRFRTRRRENPTGYIVETMQVVLQAFFDTDNFEDCLIDVVNRGGDADTTGAIAGMLAGFHYGISDIPKRWLDALDNLIRHACETQASQLLDFSKSRYLQKDIDQNIQLYSDLE